MSDKEIKVILEYEVVEDIIRAATENSKHNQSGVYGFDCDNGKHLTIQFKWE